MRLAMSGLVAAGALALVLFAQPAAAKTVCEKHWDGYQWQEQCRTTRAKNSRAAQVRRLERRIMRYLRYW